MEAGRQKIFAAGACGEGFYEFISRSRQPINRNKEFLIITIEDNGIGITNDKLLSIHNTNKIIEEFDISGIRRHGMGLKISKQIIEVHEGIFKVESKEKQFFRVIITLPLEGEV